MTGTRLAAALFVVVATVLAPPAQARRDRTAAVRAEIEASNRELMARIARGHGDEIAALYAPDAKLFPRDAPALSGRAAIASFWEALVDAGVAEVVITIDEIVVARDAATELSSFTAKAADTSVLVEGHSVAIWKKAGGRWVIWRDFRGHATRSIASAAP